MEQEPSELSISKLTIRINNGFSTIKTGLFITDLIQHWELTLLKELTEHSSSLPLMIVKVKPVTIIPLTIKWWLSKDSHGMLTTIPTTLPTLEISVVSHKTGTSNTARERFNQRPKKSLNWPLDGPLNIGTSELPSTQRMMDTPLLDHQTSLALRPNLVGVPQLHGKQNHTPMLSQQPTGKVNILDNLELSEEENTCSKLHLETDLDSQLTETLSLITGVFTEEEEERNSSNSMKDGTTS